MLSERDLAEFKRGPLQMLALFLLKKEDMYGYQIAQSIKRSSQGKFPVTEGALYIVLYRLIGKGYISKWEDTSQKKTKVFYHLEPKGEEFLADLLEAYEAMHNGVECVLNAQFDREGEPTDDE